MSWWAKHITKPINKRLEVADKWLREHGAPDIYIGAKSINDGQNFEPIVNVEYSSPTRPIEYSSPTRPIGTSKPAAYNRSTAATAKDIAQGGMTKDEVEEFNQRHPNETANIRG